jgi:ubiquinone biosynthesis protein Coq4
MQRDYSYLAGGVRPVSTTSSSLVSSSKYLNHAGLRDWLTENFLRRNGPDLPVPTDPVRGLAQALYAIRDNEAVLKMIEYEKTINPKFKAWLERRYLNRLTKEDYANNPPGSFGRQFYEYLDRTGLDPTLGFKNEEPKNDLEYIFVRNGQIHDFEHFITGGQFNTLGEIIPYFVRLSSMWKHLTPALAADIGAIYVFGGFRMIMRAALHYPDTWLTVLDLMSRGIKIGMHSEAIFMLPFEDVLHLPVEEARKQLGVNFAEEVDTEELNRIFIEEVIPPVPGMETKIAAE